MVPPAPGLLSTTICWPRSAATRWVTTRATRSVAPLAGKGTITRKGRTGHAAWAWTEAGGVARHQTQPTPPPPPPRKKKKEGPGTRRAQAAARRRDEKPILGSDALHGYQQIGNQLCRHGKPIHALGGPTAHFSKPSPCAPICCKTPPCATFWKGPTAARCPRPRPACTWQPRR